MIRALRTRLVAAAMLSLLVVLTVILGVILLGSYRGIVSDADRILDLLAEGEGTFPTLPADFNWEEEGPRRRSPELGYEIRYFSVLLDESGNVATTDLGQIAAVDQETAEAYAQQVRAQGHTRGFLQDYRYLTAQEGDQTRVIFLDYSGYLFTFRSTLFTGLWVSAVGLLAVFLLLLLLSRRIIRPILESYEKQKRFITDAGHELKTPIAIIQADTDVLTLETGEGNEWIDDIQHQVRRLSTLTNDLIYLSRMEEPQRQTAFLPLPFSDLVAETVLPGRGQEPGKNLLPAHPAHPHPGGGGEEPGTAGVHPAGQRPEVFPAGGRDYGNPGPAGEVSPPHRGQHRPNPEQGVVGEHVRPVLPGGQGPQFRAGWVWHRPIHRQGGGTEPQRENLCRRPGRPTGDDRGAACGVTPCTPSHPGAEGTNRPVLQWARETGSPVKGVKPMTAKEFYGTDWKTMDQARNQVLQAIRAGQRRPRRPGAVLYTTSRIKSPESACRKLRQRGLPATAQAALTRIRDAVGVRVICAFQDDVYQMAQYLEERPEFAVLQTKDYISRPKENGYRSYHLILGILDGPGKGMTVEVQLRTIAIDCWASLEHQIKYKRRVPHEHLVREELKRCADEIASVDLSMETIRELLNGA